jgi:hypothetical protein
MSVSALGETSAVGAVGAVGTAGTRGTRSATETITEQLKQQHPAAPVTSTTLVQLLPGVMQSLEQIPGLSGFEKKALAIEIMSALAVDATDEERSHMMHFIRTMLPVVIDIVVAASKSRIQINVGGGGGGSAGGGEAPDVDVTPESPPKSPQLSMYG